MNKLPKYYQTEYEQVPQSPIQPQNIRQPMREQLMNKLGNHYQPSVKHYFGKNRYWVWDTKHNRYLIKEDHDGTVSPLIAVMLMVTITVILVAVLSTWAVSFSPEIYFHVIEPVTTDVTIEIPEGKVTTTYPEVPMSGSATWKDVHIDPDGSITFQGDSYSYLYYEGQFEYRWSNHGWLLEKIDDSLYINGETISENGILGFIENEMLESELLHNEIDFMIHRISDLDMLDMEKPYMTINYIPMNIVNTTIRLTTSQPFELMRRHFAFYEHDHPVTMTEPVYEDVEETGFIIHETAVNKY